MTPGCVVLCTVAVLGVAVAAAPPGTGTPSSAAAPQQDHVEHDEHELSREQAVTLVQTRYGARVLRADLIEQDGRHLYVVRLLSAAGKVWIVRLDARTGSEVP
jgi:uncharacterized membrane protein YkoI